MKQLNVKKLVLLNLPYILLGLFATNLGEAWRLATGADASAKMLSFFSTLPVALGSWWPSLHPLDLAVGLCCGAALRLAVYLKGKNAKKYRHNVEYGSARWGTHEDIAPYIDPVFQNNVILTQTERLTMSSRPKNPKYARNKNVLVIGGSGSGKTRFWLKPNLMQMHSSYVVTDPKGTILVECGKMLQRGAPKLGKDGKPVKDKHGKIVYQNTTELDVDEEMTIYGDAENLARVFNNILKNAVAYSYPGTAIKISAKQTDTEVQICFQNKGKTIPAHKLESIFEKFFRLDESRSSNTGGAGLGLAIAKEIVTLHGGTISADSHDEITTFSITLPVFS